MGQSRMTEIMNYYKCELGHEQKDGYISMCHTCIVARENQRLKLLEFVKSIAEHFNFNESSDDFMQFYVKKEQEAHVLLEEIGER
jgi:hypothetical protein